MPDRLRKRPRDPNQLAKAIVEIATSGGEAASEAPEAEASALGRMGGLKGGKARAESLSPNQRKRIARKAALARWRKGSD